MRTLTASLESAQRVASQEPRVRLLVRDKQARFFWIGSEDVPNVQSALCLSNAGTIVVVCLNTTGVVRVRRVTDPTILDPTGSPGVGWGFWPDDYVQVATGAVGWPNGDVAISNNSGTLRLFYVDDGTRKVQCRTSTDDGVTWSAAEDVTGALGGTSFCLASAGQNDLFYASSVDRVVKFVHKSGGAWVGADTLPELHEDGAMACYGITAVWWAAQSKYALAVAFQDALYEDGRIVTGLYDGADVSSVQRIVPPGYATTGFTPKWPCLLQTSASLGSRFVLTYLDKFLARQAGYDVEAASWTSGLCIRSRDFAHWSYRIPLGFDQTYENRMCLVEKSGVLYVHHVNEAYRLKKWTAGGAAMNMTINQARILRYKLTERPSAAELEAEIDNRDGAYDAPGVEDSGAEAMRPLASVIVDQGLKTASGIERVETRPFYLWSVARARAQGANWCRIQAVDGWQLFRIWRPDATYVYQNKALKWLIKELAARVGYWEVEFDDSSEWNMTVSYLTLASDQNDWRALDFGRGRARWWWVVPPIPVILEFAGTVDGFTVLQKLLGLVGGAAKWGHGDSTEVLYCFIPQKQGESPTADHTFSDGEILSGLYVDSWAWPTRVRVVGAEVAPTTVRRLYQAQDIENALASGMDVFSLIYSNDLTTQAQCQTVASGALDDADARAWGGWLKVRPNVGLELWDVITFTDSKAGAGMAGVKRRVNGLVTEFDPLKKVWVQTVYLEGV